MLAGRRSLCYNGHVGAGLTPCMTSNLNAHIGGFHTMNKHREICTHHHKDNIFLYGGSKLLLVGLTITFILLAAGAAERTEDRSFTGSPVASLDGSTVIGSLHFMRNTALYCGSGAYMFLHGGSALIGIRQPVATYSSRIAQNCSQKQRHSSL